MFVLVQILGGRSRDLTVFQVEEAGPHREALASPTSPGLTQTTEAKSGHHFIFSEHSAFYFISHSTTEMVAAW